MGVMGITVVFPCDYFRKTKPDDMFVPQSEVVKRNEGDFICLDFDEISLLNTLSSDLHGKTIIYRGWMLGQSEYSKMEYLVNIAGGKMLTSTKQYLSAHYLPNWYGRIQDFTAKTIIFGDLEKFKEDYSSITWGKFFIKDYVKSLKTSNGSIIDDKTKLPVVLSEMEKYRGKIEGGICIREFEDYLPDTETRYFIVNDIPFGPRDGEVIPDIVYECIKRIKLPFFSIDVIQTINGIYRVVEIGDGQVSDFVGWDLERFISVILSMEKRAKL